MYSAFVLATGLMFVFVTGAFAHEHRKVGKYELAAGWLNEPTYVGLQNAVYLRVTDTETKKPVGHLEDSLKVEVSFGGKTLNLKLRDLHDQEGVYVADLVPTKAGTYIMRFTGEIEGRKIDEKFESGPGRFDDVQDIAVLQFPEKLGDPSALSAQLKAAQDAAASAQTIAYAGVALGILGTVLGVLGWMRKK